MTYESYIASCKAILGLKEIDQDDLTIKCPCFQQFVPYPLLTCTLFFFKRKIPDKC